MRTLGSKALSQKQKLMNKYKLPPDNTERTINHLLPFVCRLSVSVDNKTIDLAKTNPPGTLLDGFS